MVRRSFALASLLAALTGCSALTGVTNAAATITKPTRVVGATTRSLDVKVVGPGELAVAGKIDVDASAGFLNSVAILTDGGAGAGPRLELFAAAADGFVAVPNAGVTAVDLAGEPLVEAKGTSASGTVKLTVPKNQTVSVVTRFKVGEKVYRMAALLGPDAFDGTLMLDPINTMVEARVRQVLGGKESKTVTNARLKRVWTICNEAGVTLAPAELEGERTLAEVTTSLNAAWQAAIDSSVTNADEKAEIKGFISDLTSAAAPATP